MKLAHVAGKIPSEWYQQFCEIRQATGQSESALVREAIALYLKKAKAPIIKSRLDALEEKVSKLAALIIK
ncbi:ribbon-helix-helix protein, CopG family [Leptolyngbyaceae cyanobacterium UHCC 1019]